MAIKMDLEKAYDKLKWVFIKETLEDVRGPGKFIHLIWNCISTATMRVLWNGEALEEFSPMRGVWKGDPISPYFLFFFLRDYSTLLMPQYLKFYGSPFSLTEVALFTKADVGQADIIKTALDVFCESSWEKVSVENVN